jgi:hypothetical protein
MSTAIPTDDGLVSIVLKVGAVVRVVLGDGCGARSFPEEALAVSVVVGLWTEAFVDEGAEDVIVFVLDCEDEA